MWLLISTVGSLDRDFIQQIGIQVHLMSPTPEEKRPEKKKTSSYSLPTNSLWDT